MCFQGNRGTTVTPELKAHQKYFQQIQKKSQEVFPQNKPELQNFEGQTSEKENDLKKMF